MAKDSMLVAVVASVLAAVIMAVFWAPEVPDVASQIAKRPAGPIWGQETFGQTFKVHHAGVNRLDVYFGTYARVNRQNVTFRIRRHPKGRDLVVKVVDAATMRDNQFYPFIFDPEALGPDPAGKQFYFQMDAFRYPPDFAVSAWLNPSGWAYPEGAMYVRGKPTSSDLVFRTYYGVAAPEYVALMLRRLSIDKPVFNTPVFFGGVFVLYVLAAGAVSVAIFRQV